jgi:23S rRNA (pseudouridine1915-N3)-methyltransferase
MQITLICVGRLRGAPFADDAAHYEKLIRRHTRLEIEEVREAGLRPDRAEEAIDREAAAILKRLPPSAFVCALDREGKALSSTELAHFIEERRASGTDPCFVLGGAFGLGSTVLDRADLRLSLGPLTLPHELARVVLLEQLFRAHKIIAGEPYHY